MSAAEDTIDSAQMESFKTTQWSVVLQAGDHSPEESQAAIDLLCRTYWFPLYAYARRRGYGAHDAHDLVQGFFVQMLANGGMGKVDQDKGRFRAFLLASLRNFMRNTWRNSKTERRGGKVNTWSIDQENVEAHFRSQLAHECTPESQFDRDWVNALLKRVLENLRTEYEQANRTEVFDAVQPFLVASGDRLPQAEIAEQLGMSIPAVKMSVHRMRNRYAALLRSEVAATLNSSDGVEDELKWLISVMRDQT